MKNLTFQEADEKDLDIILETYNFYIDTTTATFDHNQISKDELLQRIFIGHEKYQTYLINHDNDAVGFCFLTQYRKKEAYNRTVEIGLYLKPEFTGKGIGQEAVALLEKIAISKKVRVIVASISGENVASSKLFQKMGYEKCAHYKEVGEKFNRLVDIIDYQKILHDK
jgi:L-amino acid N-acyltransferase YncA